MTDPFELEKGLGQLLRRGPKAAQAAPAFKAKLSGWSATEAKGAQTSSVAGKHRSLKTDATPAYGAELRRNARQSKIGQGQYVGRRRKVVAKAQARSSQKGNVMSTDPFEVAKFSMPGAAGKAMKTLKPLGQKVGEFAGGRKASAQVGNAKITSTKGGAVFKPKTTMSAGGASQTTGGGLTTGAKVGLGVAGAGAGAGAMYGAKKKSAFGKVAGLHDPFEVSKKKAKAPVDDKPGKVSGGRLATGGLFPGYHGAIAGKKGHKLKAVGHEVLGGMAGGVVAGPPGTVAGAAIGTKMAHDKGYYKPQAVKKSDTVSAFGIDHR